MNNIIVSIVDTKERQKNRIKRRGFRVLCRRFRGNEFEVSLCDYIINIQIVLDK